MEFFPVEVWEKIIDHVGNHEDFDNLLSAFPALQQESAVRMKMPKFYFIKAMPIIFPYIPVADVFGCRATCRMWNEAMDSHIQNHPDFLPYMGVRPSCFLTFNPYVNLVFSRKPIFDDVMDVVDFQKDMAETDKNPFPFRTVNLKIDDCCFCDLPLTESEKTYLWNAFSNFMKSFGRHIWYLTFWGVTENHTILVQFIALSLKHCPSLRSINIRAISSRAPYGSEERKTENHVINSFIEKSFPPILNSLKVLDVTCRSLPTSLVHNLIRLYGNSSVEKLKIDACYLIVGLGNYLRNIKDFSLMWASVDQISYILTELNENSLLRIQLDLALVGDRESGYSIKSRILPMLLKFNNLSFLSVTDSNGRWARGKRMEKSTSTPVTVLHNIKILEICIDTCGMDLGLLECFPNVVYLKLLFQNDDFSFVKRNIQLWDITCKKLKTVMVVGRRDGKQLYREITRYDFNYITTYQAKYLSMRRRRRGTTATEQDDLDDNEEEDQAEYYKLLGLSEEN